MKPRRLILVPIAAAAVTLAACSSGLGALQPDAHSPTTTHSVTPTSPTPCLADSALQAGTPACDDANNQAEAPAAPTTTTPPPDTPPQIVHGTGDDVIQVTRPQSPIVEFDCPSCTGNTILESNGFNSLLVNTIGSYTGKRWLDIRDTSNTTQLTVKATGSWTITVGGFGLAKMVDGPINGHGDDVVIDTANASTAKITNTGSGNFAMKNLPTSGGGSIDLAVNTIGSYIGTDPLSTPGLIEVTSDGDWSITPQ